jgi:hypothetical protein
VPTASQKKAVKHFGEWIHHFYYILFIILAAYVTHFLAKHCVPYLLKEFITTHTHTHLDYVHTLIVRLTIDSVHVPSVPNVFSFLPVFRICSLSARSV